MYFRQKCPNCGTVKEFVYVQIGHSSCCKNCNYEFTLEKKGFNYKPYLVYLGIFVALAGLAAYLIKRFHDWWIYR